MQTLYVLWGLLLLFFVVLLLIMRWREKGVARRRNGAVDPMFRRAPSTGGSPKAGQDGEATNGNTVRQGRKRIFTRPR